MEILTAAIEYEYALDFTPQDAIVYASIIEHLSKSHEQQRCFINRNSKDFDNPDIEEALDRYGCRILFKFDSGFSYVKRQIDLLS